MSKSVLKLQLEDDLPRANSPLWRKIFIFTLWTFWIVLLGLFLVAGYVWTQLYDIIETQAQQFLAERNIGADFKIISIGQDKLRIESIRLHDTEQPEGAPPFFSAESIESDYEWRELLGGRVKALRLTKPKAMIQIDSAGKIIGGWVPPTQSRGSGATVLPENGIDIIDGEVDLISPFGHVISSVNAKIKNPQQFEGALDLSPSVLAYGEHMAALSGPVFVKAEEGGYAVRSSLRLSDISSGNLAAQSGQLNLDVGFARAESDWDVSGPISASLNAITGDSFTVETMEIGSDHISMSQRSGAAQINGPLSLSLKAARHDSMAVQSLQLTSRGDVALAPQEAGADLWERLIYKGDVDVAAQGFALTDKELRGGLAETLSLSETLAKSPILVDFAPSLTAQADRLLSNSDINLAALVDKSKDNLALNLRESLELSSGKSQPWRITPIADQPFLTLAQHFEDSGLENNAAYLGEMQFGFEKPGALPLSLKGARLGFKLAGLTEFDSVTDFTGQLSQTRPWDIIGVSGEKTRLKARPVDVTFRRDGEKSDFAARVHAVITGSVPGGYMEGLTSIGDVQVKTEGENTHIIFTASELIEFDHMRLTSGWLLEDASLMLGAPFNMAGPAEKRTANIDVTDLKMRVHDGTERDFYTQIASLKGQGVLAETTQGPTQSWDMMLNEGRMRSDAFPLENTDIFSPEARVKINLAEGTLPFLDVTSPSTMVSSSLISTDEIAVHIVGTPENLVVDYDAKLFRFSDPALPQIPMAGQTQLMGGRWTGTSVAWLPEDLVTPIDITFAFENGVGSADIDIKTLQFTPKGLQPQNLVSSLRGKLAEVEGLVSASIKLGFGEGRPLTSSGSAVIENMNLAIAAGPITGLNTSLEFSSFFPLKTLGRQTVRLASFDPGFPLPEGDIEFELLPGKMRIHSAEWPIARGRIAIEPLVWDFEAEENHAVLVIDQVAIQDMIERADDSRLEITGAVEGRLPVTISGVSVLVEGGKLSVPGGGVIRFTHEGTDLAGAQNQAAGVAFDALKNFQYKALEADINGPLDGLIRLQTIFSGFNDEVFEGQPFEFDLELEGELMNLMRELNPETQKQRALSGDIVDLILKN